MNGITKKFPLEENKENKVIFLNEIGEENNKVKNLINQIISPDLEKNIKINKVTIDLGSFDADGIFKYFIEKTKETGIDTEISFISDGRILEEKINISEEYIFDNSYFEELLSKMEEIKYGAKTHFERYEGKMSVFTKRIEHKKYYDFLIELLKTDFGINNLKLSIRNDLNFFRDLYEIEDNKKAIGIIKFIFLAENIISKIGNEVNLNNIFKEVLDESLKGIDDLNRENLEKIYSIILNNWKGAYNYRAFLEI